MATTLTIPKLAMSMTEGKITKWLVDDGAAIEEGQPIYELETDKSTMEIESPAGGTLKRKVDAGDTLPIGTEIGEID